MTVKLTLGEAEGLAVAVLKRAGASETSARAVADNVVAAQAAGVVSHGLSWIPALAGHLRSGKVDGRAVPEVRRVAASAVIADARDGFPMAAIAAGTPELVAAARETGVAAMAVINSGNCLLVGRYVERIAEQGLVAFAFVNSPKSMAPWGGRKALLGTNPMAFACPRREGAPIVLDLATSKVARSEIRKAMQAGHPIPEGWALDPEGRPTTDPEAAWAGTVLPFGEHKGYGLALMMDLMAGALTGSHLSHQAPAFLGEDARPPRTGQLLLAIDPGPFAGDRFLAQVEALAAAIAEEPGAELPGDRRRRNRERSEAEGIELPEALYDQLRVLAAA